MLYRFLEKQPDSSLWVNVQSFIPPLATSNARGCVRRCDSKQINMRGGGRVSTPLSSMAYLRRFFFMRS